jgi:hypothetical protein
MENNQVNLGAELAKAAMLVMFVIVLGTICALV